jgi:hypothetical protein
MDISAYLSVVALAISLFTFYWTSIRGPKFVCASLRYIQFARPIEGHPLILISVVISNVGARTGVIDYLYLEFGQSGRQTHKFWAYLEPPNAKPTLTLPTSLENFPSAFAIQPGESVKKLLYFIPDQSDYHFETGLYNLKIKAVAAGRRKSILLQTQSMKVDEIVERGKFIIGGSFVKKDVITMGPPQK